MTNSKNKTEATTKTELLREIAIFDYVAGNQSESAKRNFEEKLERDPSLKQATEEEAKLRLNMREAGKEKPVSMSNFDALLETIDKQERQAGSTHHESETNEVENVTPLFKASKPSYWRHYASAASVAVIALVVSNFFIYSPKDQFIALSDTPASQQINFTLLASQNRLAKLTLKAQISEQQVSDLLTNFELTSFESGAAKNQRFVTAEKAISKNDLERLRSDSRVENVELFVLSDGG